MGQHCAEKQLLAASQAASQLHLAVKLAIVVVCNAMGCLLALRQHAWEEPLQHTSLISHLSMQAHKVALQRAAWSDSQSLCWQDAGIEADLQEPFHTRHTSCYA